MMKCLRILIGVCLLLCSVGYAKLRDPTQPPWEISDGVKKVMTPWQLDAVILGSDRQTAIINGQAVGLGGYIDDNQVIRIEPNSVQLQGGNGKITLFLIDHSFKSE